MWNTSLFLLLLAVSISSGRCLQDTNSHHLKILHRRGNFLSPSPSPTNNNPLRLRGGGGAAAAARHEQESNGGGSSVLLAVSSFAAGIFLAKGFSSLSSLPNALSSLRRKAADTMRKEGEEREGGRRLGEKGPGEEGGERWELLLTSLAAAAAATMAARAVTTAGHAIGSSLHGAWRGVAFWRRAVPLYIRYRLAEKAINMDPDPRRRQARWDKLHDRYAPVALKAIMKLKGFYVKVGQVMSSRNDFMPMQFIRTLSRLQDDLPALASSQVRAIIEADLRQPLEAVFSFFNFTVLGAASIGQCHSAILRATGQKVAVKVQSPHAEKLFGEDLGSARAFCRVALPEWVAILDEIERQFLTEFDYSREAANLELVESNMRKQFPRHLIHVPKPVLDLCTKNVLVMEFIPGVKLATAITQDLAYAIGSEAADKFVENFRYRLRGIDTGGEADLTNALRGPKRRRGCFDSSSLSHHDDQCIASPSEGLPEIVLPAGGCFGRCFALRRLQRARRVLRNSRSRLDRLLYVHGFQILINGAFNGDPHPGNILFEPNGALALIDYGQVKKISKVQRKQLARLVIALADHDDEAIFEHAVAMGFKTKKMDPEVIVDMAYLYFDRDGPDITGGMDARQYLEHLQSVDPVVSVADDFIMACRVSLLMRGLGSLLGREVSVAAAWKKLAYQALREP